MDQLTILHSHGPYCTKRISLGADGRPAIRGYDDAKLFSVELVDVACLVDLADELELAAANPRCFVIRAEPLPHIDMQSTRRLLHENTDPETGEVEGPCFVEVPRRWLMLDLDGQAWWDDFDPEDLDQGRKAAGHLRQMLPEPFQRASVWWSFTSGAGFKPGIRMRLAFWLDRPLLQWELDTWLANAPVDRSVFRPVQAIYVAHPILEGIADPIEARSGLLQDGDPCVAVPEIEKPAPAPVVIPRWHTDARWARDRQTERTPIAALEQAARKVIETPEGGTNPWGGAGRHHALFCAAMSVSCFVKTGRLAVADVRAVLEAAAAIARIDAPAEVDRHIRNGLRAGGAS